MDADEFGMDPYEFAQAGFDSHAQESDEESAYYLSLNMDTRVWDGEE